MIMSTFISLHTSRKQRKIKKVSALTRMKNEVEGEWVEHGVEDHEVPNDNGI